MERSSSKGSILSILRERETGSSALGAAFFNPQSGMASRKRRSRFRAETGMAALGETERRS